MLEIKLEGYEKEFNDLREKAKNELDYNFFIIGNKIEKISLSNMKDFFKCANMRKQFFNDYMFLVSSVMGVKINNSILTANPMSFVKGDFVIKYNFNNEIIEIKFSKTDENLVKLNHIGHKIGVKDNFVYGY